MGIVEELRWTAAKIANMGKFAIDSAVNESLKGSRQVYATVKGKLRGEIHLHISNGDKKRNFILVEEMQAKLEKMQEDINTTMLKDETSTHVAEELANLGQFCDEPPKSSIPDATHRKKIFIRSRL